MIGVAGLDCIKPCEFGGEAETGMVEPHQSSHAGEFEAAGIEGRLPGGVGG